MTTTNGERALWLTLRGASAAVPLGWLVWLAVMAVVGPRLAGVLGPAGAVLLVLAAGWVVARRVPSPREWLRTYHLDDDEITVMGPGPRVVRLPWPQVTTLTQEPRAVRLEGEGTVVRLPLQALVETGAWGAVLARVVPTLAEEAWMLLDQGEEVRLHPPVEPPTRLLVWWAYLPALFACVAGAGTAGLHVAFSVAVLERAVSLLLAWIGTVTLHRAGVAFRTPLRAVRVAWPRLIVLRAGRGLLLETQRGRTGFLRASLPNFWAAAPVIEIKAQLGPRVVATVHFWVRQEVDGPAVVGEIEPAS